MSTDTEIGLLVRSKKYISVKCFYICLGSEVGKAKGSLRSDPEGGQHLECPCMVSTEEMSSLLHLMCNV